MKRLFIILPFLLLLSCNDDSNLSFDKTALLTTIVDDQLIPSFEYFKDRTGTLTQKAEAFQADPTIGNLASLQSAWKEAAYQWKKTEVFSFGPTADYKSSIYFHPARINLIENALNDDDPIDLSYMELLGAAAKGLPAMEQLVFQHGKSNDEVLTLFTTDTKASRRFAYVLGIATLLDKHAAELETKWKAHAPIFISQDTADEDGVDVLANQLLLVLEVVVNTRLGEPLGKKSGTPPIPSKVEAWHSEFSNELIRANLEAVIDLYSGNGGVGFDDYLDFVKAKYGEKALSIEILDKLIEFQQTLSSLDESLQHAVINHQADVEAIYEQGRLALILVKADMFSALSITIAFTDNDGD